MASTDPITHGLIGASLSVLSGHPLQLSDPVFLGTVIGAVFPDIDIITHYKGRLNYLLNHRGASHSLVALCGMALGISAVLYVFFPQTSWTAIFIWTLIGTLSHVVSDLLNAYGAELLWPFYKKKFSVNMVMLADPTIFAMFLTSIVVILLKPELASLCVYTTIILVLFYVSFREFSRRKAKRLLADTYQIGKQDIRIIPAMYKPFSWNFLLLDDKKVRFGILRDKQPQIKQELPMWNQHDPHIANAFESAVADIFRKLTPYYHVLHESDSAGSTVQFLDLRYWVKDDFIYQGKVRIDCEGNIARETFQWETKSDGIVIGC